MATASPAWNTYFSVPDGSLCPRPQPYVFVSAGLKSGSGDTGLDTGLLNDNGGEYINLGDASGKIPVSKTMSSPVKIPEINPDIVGELDQPEMKIPGDLDTSGIISQVSFGQLGQKSINSLATMTTGAQGSLALCWWVS